MSPLNSTSQHVELYVVHLHNNNLRSNTIRSHLSAIAFQFQLAQMLPPTKSFNISKLLLSYAKSDPPAIMRKPITKQILL